MLKFLFVVANIKSSCIFAKEIKQKEIMTTQVLNLETATKSEIIIASTIQPELMKYLGGVEKVKLADEEQLRLMLSLYFAFNNEVGSFYDKNGF